MTIVSTSCANRPPGTTGDGEQGQHDGTCRVKAVFSVLHRMLLESSWTVLKCADQA